MILTTGDTSRNHGVTTGYVQKPRMNRTLNVTISLTKRIESPIIHERVRKEITKILYGLGGHNWIACYRCQAVHDFDSECHFLRRATYLDQNESVNINYSRNDSDIHIHFSVATRDNLEKAHKWKSNLGYWVLDWSNPVFELRPVVTNTTFETDPEA